MTSARQRFLNDATLLRNLATWLEKSAPAEGTAPDKVESREVALAYFRLGERLDWEAASAREFATIYAGPIP